MEASEHWAGVHTHHPPTRAPVNEGTSAATPTDPKHPRPLLEPPPLTVHRCPTRTHLGLGPLLVQVKIEPIKRCHTLP